MPSRRKKRIVNWKRARFLIACVGMADAWMWPFDADGKWFMYHGTPGATLVPFPRTGRRPASLEEALFLADCIAFDHDSPTVVRPKATSRAASRRPLQPVITGDAGPAAGISYFEELETALLMITEMRVGGSVELRYHDDVPQLTAFKTRFANVAEPLSLYAMATRQVDILSEYLCLYRVLEAAHHDNGKSFIVQHLGQIATRNFGVLHAHAFPREGGVDVFRVYRRRALARIKELRDAGKDDRGIAKHLYGVRNGLAHGKRGIVVHDFGKAVASVAADLPIVKLLARMVVEP